MITEDGYCVGEGSFWKRVDTMRLVLHCLRDPQLTKAMKPKWIKFVSVAFQYIFIGRYRCLEGKELEEWNSYNV